MRYLGIRGFESILRGGIPGRAEVLLLTSEGGDRHLLGAHWIVEGLSRGERALVLLSAETPEAFLARLGRMGVDVPSALASGSLAVIDWHTCWTQPVEGVVEEHRILRASRHVSDLFAAVDRAVPSLLPAPDRRAFVDFLPLAYKALDDVQATEALAGLRTRLSEAGATSIFVAERSMGEARVDALLQTFHAVLDARSEGRETLSFAVLGVGGVKLTPRYRRVRMREDGASVESEPTPRTFSCPICDARVPFVAQACPSCGTPRSEMPSRARSSGLMDYVESLGRTAPPESPRGRVSVSPRQTPPGFTNGMGPSGRVNGSAPARVNGAAPGRVNGIAPAGRTNGLQAAAGRTNGIVNGLRRARAGVTNGLTNGSGFTNGLGSPRYRYEARRSRWKLFLVPTIAAALMISPFLLAEVPPTPRFSIDGAFADWAGVPGYAQDPPADATPSVAITGYKVVLEPGELHLYATVAGEWFDDATEVEALYAFVDGDRDAATGYEVHGLGADALVEVEGTGGTVTSASVRTFSGGDRNNWSAWQATGSASAAVSGGELEATAPWDEPPGLPTILLMADDSRGSRSYSAVAFGPDLGALRASVRSRANVVAQGTPDVLAVDLEAFGAPVTVTALRFEMSDPTISVRTISPPLPLTVIPEANRTLTVQLDTTSGANGTLLAIRVANVTADRPVLVATDLVRVYIESFPNGKRVDGWFGDWAPAEFTSDGDPPVAERDRDIDRHAATRTGTDLFMYVDVRGTIFAGSAVPARRAKAAPGGESQPSAPAPLPRVVGEDVLRVYVDADAGVTGGLPVLDLRGADLLLEIRGIQGRVTERAAFAWQDGWRPLAVPPAEHDEKRLEASLPIPATGAVEVVFETRGWQGPTDSTEVSGTRGVRSESTDTYRAEGRFSVTFTASGRVDVSAEGAAMAWTLPDLGTGSWNLAPTPVGVLYVVPEVEVHYTVSDWGVKEEIVFLSPPDGPALEFGFWVSEGTFVWHTEGEPIGILAASRPVFELPQPYAVDASGVVTSLSFDLDLAAGVLRIPLPPSLRDAPYPLTVDPVTQYTLRNDGPANDTTEWLGYSVAVGDFNGDGYADVLTGAPNNDRPPRDSPNGLHGFAYVYYGPFSADDDTPNVWINSTMTNSTRFGYSVAAGKFNGDQYWDALVSRRSYLPGGWVGNVSLYYGSGGWSGEESTPDVNFVPPNNPKNFGEIVAGGNLDDASGDDVLIAEQGRDIDGDGHADGVVYVYMSPFAAAETASDYRLVPSTNGGGQLGLSLAVGKVDSDAYADVVVGEPKYQNGAGDGRLQFYEGSHFTTGSGDVTPDATIGAPSGGGNTGNFGASVAIGRLNTDSYGDLLAGAPFKFMNDGRAYVFLANSDGSGLTSGASPSTTLTSQTSEERFGSFVLIADWSNDGTADALVGAPQAPAGGTNRGSVYWFNNPLVDQTVDETISGAQNNEFFGRVLAGGKFANDANTILAIGAYLWDKNSGNPNDNDGRVVVATVPEPIEVMVAVIVLAVFGAVFRRKDVRSRRHRNPERSRTGAPASR